MGDGRSTKALAGAFVLALLPPAGGRGEGDGGGAGRADLPAAAEIVERAVERARRAEREGLEELYTYRRVGLLETLAKDGVVEERRLDVHEQIRVEGEPYLLLVSRDNRPLDEEEQRVERERREAFAEKVRAEGPPPADEDEVRFDEDLVARYRARLDHIEPIGGRPAYALSYWPRAGDLPETRRIDRVLNNSWGRIWIDVETFEVARLEFELIDKVRFWWFMGSVSELRGHFVRQPVDGVWLPKHGSVYLHGRVVFRTIRRRQEAAWVDYERIDAAAGRGR